MSYFLNVVCILPISGCIALLLLYVLSLYVWPNTHLRNDPSVIKKRFLSVFITSIISPSAIYLFSSNDFASKYSILDLLGIRFPGIFMASTVPLILTMILFLGPLTMQSQTDNWQLYSESPQHVSTSNMPQMRSKHDSPSQTDSILTNTPLKPDSSTSKNTSTVDSQSATSIEENSQSTIDIHLSPSTNLSKVTSDCECLSSPDKNVVINTQKTRAEGANLYEPEPMYWLASCKDLIWLRDHIIAPLSEELTFRACMLPLLLQCFRPQSAVFICPLFFGIAHFHHVYGRVKGGCKLKTAILVSGFQFLFTTLFGAYSAFLFLRTGHIVAPFMAHAFCNHIGFPNFREIWFYPEPKRSITSFLCVVGLSAWCCLLEPLTNPTWYENSIYWKV